MWHVHTIFPAESFGRHRRLDLRTGNAALVVLRKDNSVANLRKVPYTKPIPSGAELFSRMG